MNILSAWQSQLCLFNFSISLNVAFQFRKGDVEARLTAQYNKKCPEIFELKYIFSISI